MRLYTLARFSAVCVAALLAGCGGGGAGSLLGLGGGGCTPHSVSLTFPASGGYSASGQLTSATQCFSSATINTYADTAPILGSPFTSNDSSMQVQVYLGLAFSATEYANGLPSLSVTMPSAVVTAGRQFYLAYNGGGGGAFGWEAAAEGPASVSGSTLSFASGNGNTTFDANQEAEFAVYSVAAP